jgi:hypothetical protein
MSPSRHALGALTLAGLGALLALGSGGCETEAYCFTCTNGASASGGSGNALGEGGDSGLIFGGMGNTTGGRTGSGGSAEGGASGGCEDTRKDPNNCGRCGNVCVFQGAFAKCVDGECAIDRCAPGRVDSNDNPEDGCELACVSSGEEVCDGRDNDCDGEKDEGFDLGDDVENCGFCGNVCAFAHATVKCAKDEPSDERPSCQIASCESGFVDRDKVRSNGCEYECTPTNGGVEICDELDNDCDGQLNEDVGDVGQQCDPSYGDGALPGVGVCTWGVKTCDGTKIVCVPGVGPSTESCNELDDDCDGEVDEDFQTPMQTDIANCGACGNRCEFENGVADCVAGKCVLNGCRPGFEDVDDDESNGCEYTCPAGMKRTETCNGIDDDCDGIKDNPVEVAKTKPSLSVCSPRPGTPCSAPTLSCVAGAWKCSYPAEVELGPDGKPALSETLCDGKDNNCDGDTDESFIDLGDACDDGDLGLCRDAGVRVCHTNKTQTTCDLSVLPDQVIATPQAEVCDGLDNDCDGKTDEDVTNTTFLADVVTVNWGGVNVKVDRYEASRPDATAVSSGLTETHVCTRAGVLPWANVSYANAAAACAASGRRLCTANELKAACASSSTWAYPYGNTYQDATCNGLDYQSVGAVLRTGFLPNCARPTVGIYDLSGNLAEWTSTKKGATSTPPVLDIMALHGGSYLTPGFAMTCSYDLARITVNAVTPSIGFRCCQ